MHFAPLSFINLNLLISKGLSFTSINTNLIINKRFLSMSALNKRGVFILFEGIDRCGKSTQCSMLSDYLSSKYKSELIRFPDRTSSIGQLINSYLSSATNLNDQTIHLLFSANRWEAAKDIEAKLNSGCNLICDRYAYSGVAFSAAKGLDLEWCKSCDGGLPAPDVIIYLVIYLQMDPPTPPHQHHHHPHLPPIFSNIYLKLYFKITLRYIQYISRICLLKMQPKGANLVKRGIYAL